MKPKTVKLNELKKEIDAFRGPAKLKSISKEQKEFLILCREHDRPVGWIVMADLWNNKLGWEPKATAESLRKWFSKVRAGAI